MSGFFIGIDQGTSLTTAVLTDDRFRVLGKASIPHHNFYPQPGWMEEDPEEILENCILAARKVLEEHPQADAAKVTAIGLDHQGETCCAWNRKTGKPVSRAIVWQDRRTSGLADRLEAEHGKEIRKITGVMPDAYYSATKFRWILDNVPEAAALAESGDLCLGTLNTFIFWHLTGGDCFRTEPSSASCMMLMDLKECRWSPFLLDLLGLQEDWLPEICDCSDWFGETDFLGPKIPITASLADSHASIIGVGCFREGMLKTSYGTGNFMSFHTGKQPVFADRIYPDCIWRKDGEAAYRLRGACYSAGAAIDWLRNGIRLIDKPEDSERLARAVPDSGGVVFVPALSGLATPYWDPYARGLLIGLTGGSTNEHIVRAVLESIACQVAVCAEAMRDATGRDGIAMRADGGMVENSFLMQLQADLLNLPVEIPDEKETAALGAACAAGITVRALEGPESMLSRVRIRKTYEPAMPEEKRIEMLSRWKRAVERSRSWAAEEE